MCASSNARIGLCRPHDAKFRLLETRRALRMWPNRIQISKKNCASCTTTAHQLGFQFCMLQSTLHGLWLEMCIRWRNCTILTYFLVKSVLLQLFQEFQVGVSHALLLQYYKRLCGAVLLVQRCFRGWSSTRRLRGEYLALHRAAVVVQASWRGTLARRHFKVSD